MASAHTKVKKGFGSANWQPKPAPAFPTAFAQALDAMFAGSLRIRWSVVEGAWHLEQQVGRGAALPPLGANPWRDDWIRANDGFALVMVVQPRPDMHCPVCDATVQAPYLECAEVFCARCRRNGSDARHMAAYFPLGDALLAHLRSISPLLANQRHRVAQEEALLQRRKRWEEEAEQRELAAQLKDAAIEQLPKAGFPSLTPSSWTTT
jgi:hypothetical protein